MPRKIILHCRLSPGDVLTLTAAVESLHGTYPGEYLTDVRISINYTDNAGNPDTMTWLRPYIGGSASDPAPPSDGHSPIAHNPPDPTLAADSKRHSNLPMPDIVAAVNSHFPNPPGKVIARVDSTIGTGDFVSNFMAYHVVWYREWWNAETTDPNKKCRKSGHTHVGTFVAVTDAEKAVEIQLDELIEVLNMMP